MPFSGSYQRAMLVGKDQHARTPRTMLRLIKDLYFRGRPFHDPCPSRPTRDGLTSRWPAQNFVNPPFRQIRAWVEKAVAESGHTVLLIPARVGTRYLSHTILPNATSLVIWTNKVAFAPYTKPIAIPILTVSIHGGPLHLPEGLQARRVRFDYWSLPAKPASQLLPLVQHKYRGTRYTYTQVAGSPQAALARALERCQKTWHG